MKLKKILQVVLLSTSFFTILSSANATESYNILYPKFWKSASANNTKIIFTSKEQLNTTNDQGVTPLMLAAKHAKNIQLITKMLQAGANPNIKDNKNRSVLDYLDMNPIDATETYWRLRALLVKEMQK